MKRKKFAYGFEWHRLGYKNAWYYACKDSSNQIHIVFMSYETPIMIVNVRRDDSEPQINVLINDDAFNYSRTTSKQINQFINELRNYTNYGHLLDCGILRLCCAEGEGFIYENNFVYANVVSKQTIEFLLQAFTLCEYESKELCEVAKI